MCNPFNKQSISPETYNQFGYTDFYILKGKPGFTPTVNDLGTRFYTLEDAQFQFRTQARELRSHCDLLLPREVETANRIVTNGSKHVELAIFTISTLDTTLHRVDDVTL